MAADGEPDLLAEQVRLREGGAAGVVRDEADAVRRRQFHQRHAAAGRGVDDPDFRRPNLRGRRRSDENGGGELEREHSPSLPPAPRYAPAAAPHRTAARMGNPAEGPTPPGWKLILVKWLGVYPPLVALVYGIDWFTKNYVPTDWPAMTDAGTLWIWVKLLCTTAVLVSAMHYFITPWMDSLFERWLYTEDELDRMKNDPEIER